MSYERPTFSPLWHRVRALRPRLRPHVQVTRQFYRGRRWHVAHDPTSNQFYRLSPVAHEFVGLLDGQRTVEEVWQISLQNHGDGAPTQQEVIELLGQMYQANLLALDLTPETEQLLARGRERLKKKMLQQAIGIMYFKVRVFNPDRYLAWIEPILRPVLNRWGFMAWAALVLYTLVALIPRWDDLVAQFREAIAPANWGWMLAVFVVLKAIHETGHGVLVKRFGGQVPEFGFMLLVLLPAPYVDASAAWAFPGKWRRIAVGAGGMVFELFVAALAGLVWMSTAPGLVNQLAFNAMLTASISTVLFNANPLMRFDGYYMLSDLLEVPNLMQRSNKMLLHLCQKHIYRVEQTRPPSTQAGERWILIVFGVLSTAYRIFLFFTITLYVMGKMFAIGLVLAIWTAAMWFILPAGKFVHWLATNANLNDIRARAVATTLLLAAIITIAVGVIPAPDRRRASGVVESVASSGVFFTTDGFVTQVHARVGDRVRKGDPILTCSSPMLESRLQEVTAQLAEYEAALRRFIASDPTGAQVVREQIAAHRELILAIKSRLDGLVVRAPHDGVIVAGLGGVDPGEALGAFVRRGQQVCEVVDPDHTRVTAIVETGQAQPIIQLPPERVGVEVRAVSSPSTLLRAQRMSIIPAGQRRLPHPALGHAGGGTIATEQRDERGVATTTPLFRVTVEGLATAEGDQPWRGVPGERVHLRFELPPRPLIEQWVTRLRQLIQGRVDL